MLERVVEPAGSGDADPYFAELALRHEEMHAEAFHYTRQTLGYPAPAGMDVSFEHLAPEGDFEAPGGLYRSGCASRATGFAFDNEKWSHPVVLAALPDRAALRDER